MTDCLIVGGGVVGLSLAYELAGRGLSVRVLDAGQPGREASWAGAGILPPASSEAADPLERLVALSNRLHARWSEQLRDETGIDNGYRQCGAVYVARQPDDVAQLEHLASWAAARGFTAERLSASQLAAYEPGLKPAGLLTALSLPQECQIRNPRHLKALLAGCLRRGVEITAGASVSDFVIRGQRVRGVQSSVGLLESNFVCLASGAWSTPLARRLGLELAIKPIRGQILLLNSPRSILGRIVNEGSRYLVPRTDGRLLVGSTEEDVGFDKQTTAGVTADLLGFALSLSPQLASATVERSWAGLRPATVDGLPYLGRVSALENLIVAAGHFRGGLQMSPGTALVLAEQMLGLPSSADLESFRPDRPTVSTPRVSWPELAPSATALRS